MPNIMTLMGKAVKRLVGYGRDLTPPADRQREAERLQQIAVDLRRAGVNTQAVRRAAEIQESAGS